MNNTNPIDPLTLLPTDQATRLTEPMIFEVPNGGVLNIPLWQVEGCENKAQYLQVHSDTGYALMFGNRAEAVSPFIVDVLKRVGAITG